MRVFRHRLVVSVVLCVLAVPACSGDGASSGEPDAQASSGGSDASGTPDAASPGIDSGSSGTNDASGDTGPKVYPDPIAGIAAPTLIKGGYQFVEGPLWLPQEKKLIFSDIPANRIYGLTDGETEPVVFRDPSNHANGHALAANGVFYTCEQGIGGGRITRTLAGGTVETVVSTFGGKNLNAPNDAIVRSDGTVYFTDPNYSGNTQPKQNVFRIAPGASTATVVDDTLAKPNGIALSPDEKTLYVASYEGDFIHAYALATDGSAGPPTKRFVNVGSPDGIAVDDAGNVYAAVNSGVAVYRPDGTLIGTVPVPNGKRAANIAFGGTDRKTLFITAQTDVYRVVLNVPGPP